MTELYSESEIGNRLAREPAVVETEQTVRASILIVDDRTDKLTALDATLSDLGSEIVHARSGNEALRALLKQDFAVILLDVNMPGMDGFETATLIRQRPRSELTPIIFISAMDNAESHISRGYSLGAVDYILTPIIPEILRAKVSVFVDLYRKTVQIKRQADDRANRLAAESARAEAESARERSALLAEASGVLASSFDVGKTLAEFSRLAVSKVADYCELAVADESGGLRCIAVAHHDPAADAALRGEGRRCELFFVRDAVAHVAARGETISASRLDGKWDHAAMAAAKAPSLAALAEIDTCLIAPLRARDRIFGVLCLASGPDRHFAEGQAALVDALAERVGLALDNAALYHAAERARQSAERASRAKDQFLAMLSHELRTPLTPVLNAVGLIEAEEGVSEHMREIVSMIRRNVELEARLIDDLLDLTRVSKGKVQLNLAVADGHELLRNTIEICQSEIQAKPLELETCFEATLHHLKVDSARLQQVFWNLIKNAVKFTSPGGRLIIRTTNVGQRFRVDVADTGVGIDPDVLPRVFDAFEQGRGDSQGGLGLGLAITRALVLMHGGEIIAHSRGRGEGSTFSVIFETIPAPAEESQKVVPDAAEKRLPLRLLLVEDHVDTNRSLSRLLDRRGYTVRAAESMQSALGLAGEYDFDVLVSDMGLPDGSGIRLMEELRRIRPIRGVALSGFGMEEDIRRSKAVGFVEHLTKPVDIARLDAAIQRAGRL